MNKKIKDIISLIKEKGIKMVDFKMVDINGQYRHVTIPAESFSEDIMISGIGFDASNYGYAVVEKSDMVFIPDPDTAIIDPFCEILTLSMSGNAMIIDSPQNRPLAQYPRNIVLAAEKYMRDTGIADTMLILPEFEFYLFDNVGWEVSPNSIAMNVDAGFYAGTNQQRFNAVNGFDCLFHHSVKRWHNRRKNRTFHRCRFHVVKSKNAADF